MRRGPRSFGQMLLMVLGISFSGRSWGFPYIPKLETGACQWEERSSPMDVSSNMKIAQACLESLEWIRVKEDPVYYNVAEKYRENFKGRKGIFQVENLEMIGSAREQQYFLKLVGQEENDGYRIPDHILRSLRKSDCGRPIEVECALGALFGQESSEPRDAEPARREAGMRAMNVAVEFGYTITPRQYYYERPIDRNRLAAPPEWSLNSVRQMDTVLRKLPPSFRHMKSLKYIYRTMGSDQDLVSMKTNAWTYTGLEPEIVLKQSTFNEMHWSRGRVVGVDHGDHQDGSCTFAHEMAHAFEHQFPEKVESLDLFRNEYNRWGFKITSARDPTYPGMEKLSDYAFTNRHEYFAVAMDKFLCEPEALKREAPGLFFALKEKIFDNKDFLGDVGRNRDWNRRRVPEKNMAAKDFQVGELGKRISTECLGGPKIQAKYRIDPISGKGLVYYYKKGFIRQSGRIRRVAIGRTSSHEFFTQCFFKKAMKAAEEIMGKFSECHPPDRKGLVEELINRARSIVDDFDYAIRKKASGI